MVRDVRADIFQPRVSTRPFEGRRILAHLRELVSRLCREVHAVDRAGAGFDERERHLESETAVPARHERDAVSERELLLEQRRVRI